MTPESPDGLNLHPEIPAVARVSKRALMVMFGIAIAVVIVLFYGAQKRQAAREEQERERAKAVVIEPASAEGVIQANPTAPVQPVPPAIPLAPNSPFPESQISIPQQHAAEQVPVKAAPTAEEIAAERTRQAMLSPMVIKQEAGAAASAYRPSHPPPPVSSSLEAPLADGSPPADDYALVNMQRNKKAFLAAGVKGKSSADYLEYTRTRQLAPCEIKAGWEIPAVLEQDINSDLPGELKALVSQNVYDTATGKYLLVPQGSRLVGKYSSEVGYGQTGAQVIWNRIIYPDGSSINLAGMVGLDSQGNAGFRDKVDRHYKRTFGMAFLTSAFVAAYELTNQRAYGNYGYSQPTAGDRAMGSFAGEMSNTAAAMTRKNMNVQPTIQIRAGYRFTVRVNRDMLFDAPYAPDTPAMEPEPLQRLQRANR